MNKYMIGAALIVSVSLRAFDVTRIQNNSNHPATVSVIASNDNEYLDEIVIQKNSTVADVKNMPGRVVGRMSVDRGTILQVIVGSPTTKASRATTFNDLKRQLGSARNAQIRVNADNSIDFLAA